MITVIFDGPYVISVPSTQTTYLVKDLQFDLIYSIVVSMIDDTGIMVTNQLGFVLFVSVCRNWFL